MQVISINTAEAIFEPFWDPELREMDQWSFELPEKTGIKLIDWWCSFNFEWQTGEKGEPVFSMSRRYGEGVDVSRYDLLLLSAMLPNGCVLRIEAETDRGPRQMDSEPFGEGKRELALPLAGATRILSLRLTVLAAGDASGVGWFNWAGLQSSARLPDYLAQFREYDAGWEGSLYPEGIPLSFRPKYGIFFSGEQLEDMRALYREKRAAGAASPYAPDDSYEKYWDPEGCIGDFVNFWDDTRYCRERDSRHYLIRNGVRAAMYGVLEKDAASLRLAARYAMSILACAHWDDGMICDFPAGSWEHRCFVQSLCLYDLVFIYDLAYEFFAPPAKSRLFRRLADEGIASINFNAWRHEYIFHNNQMIWFSHGRMAAYALLGKEWPRTAPYMELALRDVEENIENTVLPDGGYVEGPTYFTCVGQNGGQALYLYARAAGKDLAEVTPERLKASVNFADALLSTDRGQDMIPICDGKPLMPQSHLAFMAKLLPESGWNAMFWKAVERSGGLADDYFALLSQSTGRQAAYSPPAFVKMPELNLLASHRMLHGEAVKIVLLGNRSGAGHTHEDKGSFILEYAGQTFAMDPGTCDYSSPFSMLYKHCQRHNVLVPAGSRVRPAAENPCMQTISPDGEGDAQRLHASIEAGKAYPDYYESWTRELQSDSPEELVITDRYRLKEGCGCGRVEFLWNTVLPVRQEGDAVLIEGERAAVRVEVPEGCRCELRRLELFGGGIQNQIAFVREGTAGQIRTRAVLQAPSAPADPAK